MLLERGGRRVAELAPRRHPDRDREQCLGRGLAKKPLSPVLPGASEGSLLAHTSRGRGTSTWGVPGCPFTDSSWPLHVEIL